jgi:hypothetical protein
MTLMATLVALLGAPGGTTGIGSVAMSGKGRECASLLDFLLPSSPFTFDVLSPSALRDPLLSLRRQSASIV